ARPAEEVVQLPAAHAEVPAVVDREHDRVPEQPLHRRLRRVALDADDRSPLYQRRPLMLDGGRWTGQEVGQLGRGNVPAATDDGDAPAGEAVRVAEQRGDGGRAGRFD